MLSKKKVRDFFVIFDFFLTVGKFSYSKEKIENHEKNRDFFFEKIFHLEKKNLKKYFLSMSNQNFPKIPKIALRKSYDERKHLSQQMCTFFD